MEKTLTTTEQNLAALNITEDEANSRQGSRNKLYSYNNNRRDSRRPNHVIIDTQFHNKTTPNVAKSTIHSPQSAMTVATRGRI